MMDTWQIVLGVGGLVVACIGPTILWAQHVRQDGRWQGTIEGKIDNLTMLVEERNRQRSERLEDARREHAELREIGLGAHRKADRALQRLGAQGAD